MITKKKVLLDALREILEAAQDPETFVETHAGGFVGRSLAKEYALGWIKGAARHALGLPETTL